MSTEIRARFQPEYHPDIADWWASVQRLPRGERGKAVLEVIRRGLEAGQRPPDPQASPAAVLELEPVLPEIREMVEEAIGDALGGNLRRIVEAAVTSALSSMTIVAGGIRQPSAETDETEALLDAFMDNVLE